MGDRPWGASSSIRALKTSNQSRNRGSIKNKQAWEGTVSTKKRGSKRSNQSGNRSSGNRFVALAHLEDDGAESNKVDDDPSSPPTYETNARVLKFQREPSPHVVSDPPSKARIPEEDSKPPRSDKIILEEALSIHGNLERFLRDKSMDVKLNEKKSLETEVKIYSSCPDSLLSETIAAIETHPETKTQTSPGSPINFCKGKIAEGETRVVEGVADGTRRTMIEEAENAISVDEASPLEGDEGNEAEENCFSENGDVMDEKGNLVETEETGERAQFGSGASDAPRVSAQGLCRGMENKEEAIPIAQDVFSKVRSDCVTKEFDKRPPSYPIAKAEGLYSARNMFPSPAKEAATKKPNKEDSEEAVLSPIQDGICTSSSDQAPKPFDKKPPNAFGPKARAEASQAPSVTALCPWAIDYLLCKSLVW
ncbi:hypothetical protein U1Q18_037838 [Sarracenia purpurea var. burkii]